MSGRRGFVTGGTQKVKEGTVTFGYSPVKSFEVRLEARYDWSNEDGFETRVNDNATFVDHQTGFAVQGLYHF